MQRVLITLVVVLVLISIVAVSILKSDGGREGVKVYAEETRRTSITQVVKASGQVDPRVKVNLSAHVIGKIEKMYIEEGDEVEAGDPVLDLERDTFLAVHDRTAAQLRISRTQLLQAQIDLKNAEVRHRRYAKLGAEGVVPAEEAESAALERDLAELRQEQAREEIERVQADLDKAKEDLKKTTLYSPLSGRVIALNAAEGEVVVSGTMNNPASVIATIADMSELVVEIDVDETEIVQVAPTQAAKVVVDAVVNHEYEGKVIEIGSSGFNNKQQPDVTFFKVKILLEDADETLRAGMSARAEIAIENHNDALVVPIQSVVYRERIDVEDAKPKVERSPDQEPEETQIVFVIEDGKAQQRPVVLGLADTTDVEIVEGLSVGEQVVTGAYRVLKDLEHDDPVRVVEDTADAEDKG